MSCDDAGDFLREDLLPGCKRFYFDIYQSLSADRLQDLGQRGDPLACKSRIEITSGIEFPQGLKREVGDFTAAVRSVVDRVVMYYHDVAVGR